MSDERDDKAKGGRGKRTVLDAHMQTHLPQHQREWVRRTIDEYLYQKEMPPRYRARYEGGEGREKAEGKDMP